MTYLSLSVLGAFEVALDGHPALGFESARTRALLAYLAVEAGWAHRRASLAGLLWPNLPEEAARTNLRRALANLRSVIERRGAAGQAAPPFLLVSRDAIQFNVHSEHWLDVAAFTTLFDRCDTHPHRRSDSCTACAQWLAEAVTLYHGNFLEQFYLSDSEAFEEWAALKRAGLHQHVLGALARLAAHHERCGRYEDARQYAIRQLELEPWLEEAHRQLIRVLWLSGQRSAALAQYERCRHILLEELGVEPARETRALNDRIRDAEREGMHARRIGVETSGNGLEYRRHTLPEQLTPFVGRESELAQLIERLQRLDGRLITLVGPGGIGKTRLALQGAAAQLEGFRDGVSFVSLVAIKSADLIVPAIASALNIVFEGRVDPNVQLLKELQPKELLLVLDNIEHLLDREGTVAGLVAAILQQAPAVSILITSRERVHLRGEWVVQLDGLACPPATLITGLEAYSGVQLFLHCADRAQADLAPAEDELRWIAHICRLVEGMPLAIELAATWVHTLSCREIAHEIERGLASLTTPLRDVPSRHRSMQAVFDHSWQLLSEQEQRVLGRLSVFRGGFNRACAEQVAEATLPVLASLIDRSWLRKSGHPSGAARYDLHELVRQYAHDQLDASGELPDARDRHLASMFRLVEAAEPHLFGAEQEAWLAHLEMDLDNVRAALEWSLRRVPQSEGTPSDAPVAVEHGLRLAGALWWFWWLRSHVREGRRWLEALLAIGSSVSAAARAKALHGAGWLAAQDRDYERAVEFLEQSLALARELQDTGRIVVVLHALGEAARWQGDHRSAIPRFEEAATISRELRDTRGLALALGNLGTIAHAEHDSERAASLLEQSLARSRELGDTFYTGWWVAFLGRVAKDQHRYPQAATFLVEALTLLHALGNQDGVAFTLEGSAYLAAAERKTLQAAQLFGAAEALRKAINSPMAPFDRPEYDRNVAEVRAALDPATFTAAWAAGRAMTPEQAIAYALAYALEETNPG